MTILAHSLNGQLRIRSSKDGKTGVVEIRAINRPEDWSWCVWPKNPIERAWELFNNQTKFHTEHSSNTVQPGV
jgi:hypothetical protein